MKLIPRNFFADDIFDDFFAPAQHEMKCDIYEKDNNYILEMSVPGFDKKDISIEEKNGYLYISAEKNEEINDDSKNYIRRERSTRKFQRSFYLGDINTSNIKAELKDGILTVKAPKLETIESKNTIEIE